MSETAAVDRAPTGVRYEAAITVVDDDGLALRVIGGHAVELEEEVYAVLAFLTRVLDADALTVGDTVGTVELTPSTRLVTFDLNAAGEAARQ